MKQVITIVIITLLALGVPRLQADVTTTHYTDVDWFAADEAEKVDVPTGLTEREAEICRAGFTLGHYSGRNPEYVVGLFVLNTKTKKYHLSNCPNTLQIDICNRDHCALSPEELESLSCKPCGMCSPETTYCHEWVEKFPEELKQYQEWFYSEWEPGHQEWMTQHSQ